MGAIWSIFKAARRKPERPMSKTASRHSATMIAGIAVAMLVATAIAQPNDERIPQFASTQFGWQTNLEDWQDPPPGSGHGPMRNDPAYPYLSNADANRQGKQPTIRITNSTDPILKPWAQEEIQKTNEELLSGQRHVP